MKFKNIKKDFIKSTILTSFLSFFCHNYSEFMQKTVDIIVNCFNGEKYLSEALDSILKQGYKSWRVIFIDNCSTDNSKNIAKNFKRKFNLS